MIAGSRAKALADLADAGHTAIELLPDARRFALPVEMLTADLAPLYGRPPDARLPA